MTDAMEKSKVVVGDSAFYIPTKPSSEDCQEPASGFVKNYTNRPDACDAIEAANELATVGVKVHVDNFIHTFHTKGVNITMFTDSFTIYPSGEHKRITETTYSIREVWVNNKTDLKDLVKLFNAVGKNLIDEVTSVVDETVDYFHVKIVSKKLFEVRWKRLTDWCLAHGYKPEMTDSEYGKWKKRFPVNFIRFVIREKLLGIHVPKQCIGCKHARFSELGTVLCDGGQKFYYVLTTNRATGQIETPDKLTCSGATAAFESGEKVYSNVIADSDDAEIHTRYHKIGYLFEEQSVDHLNCEFYCKKK